MCVCVCLCVSVCGGGGEGDGETVLLCSGIDSKPGRVPVHEKLYNSTIRKFNKPIQFPGTVQKLLNFHINTGISKSVI